MAETIDDLKQQVAGFVQVKETNPKSAHNLRPKALSNALSAICNKLDHPISAYAIEHTTSFSGSPEDFIRLPVIVNNIGLAADKAPSKIAALKPSHLPALAAEENGFVVFWGIMREGEHPTAVISRFSDDDVAHEKQEEVLLSTFKKKKLSILTLKLQAERQAENRLISVRNFFASPVFSTEAIFATVAINLIGLIIPLFTMNVYDRVLPNFSTDTLKVLAIGVCIAAAFDFILRLLRAHIVDATAKRVDILFLTRIFGRYLASAMPKRRSSVGADVNVFRDTDVIRDFHSSAALAIFGDLPFIFIFLAVIAFIGGPLVFVTLAAIVTMLLVGVVVQRPLARLTEESFQNTASRNTVLIETIAGIETLKATGSERRAAEQWEKATGAQIRTGVKSRSYTNFVMSSMVFLQTIATVGLVVFAVHLIIAGTISAGAMLACMIIQGRAMGPVSQISGLILRLYQVRAAERALRDIQNRPLERRASSRFIKHPGINGQMEFQGVSFTYDEETKVPALKEVNLTFQQGERVAIIGASGSGKSTLLKLMAKLYKPDSGRIFLDGIGLNALDPSEIRRHLGWAGADSTIFAGTIRENMTNHAPNVSDEAVLDAVKTAGALDWINTLSHGFDTLLSEGGMNLSSGQRQTLVLARALVTKPPVLLLDEPTSNMDGRLERRVIESFKRANSKQTMLVVTHRPSLFELVDRIVVMDKGEVLFDGPKAKVLEKISKSTPKKRHVSVSQNRIIRSANTVRRPA